MGEPQNHKDVPLIGWRKREERWFTFSCRLSGISNCWQKTKENCLSRSKDLLRFKEHCTAGKLYYVLLIIFSNNSVTFTKLKLGEASTYNVFDFSQNYLHTLSLISLTMRAFCMNCGVATFNHFLTVREEIVSMSQQTGIPHTLKLLHPPERLEMLDQICLRSVEDWSSHVCWLNKSNCVKGNTALNERPGSLFEEIT